MQTWALFKPEVYKTKINFEKEEGRPKGLPFFLRLTKLILGGNYGPKNEF